MAQGLGAAVDDARASEQFQRWLDVQAAFHDYSFRNTLLIERVCTECGLVVAEEALQQEPGVYARGPDSRD